MLRWMRWHCPPDTGFEIRAMAVWGRARYLSFTKALHNIESLRVSGEETFCFFETWRSEWGSSPRSPTFQAGGFNQGPRPHLLKHTTTLFSLSDHDILSREWSYCSSSRDQLSWQAADCRLLIMRDFHYGRMCFKSVKTLGAFQS